MPTAQQPLIRTLKASAATAAAMAALALGGPALAQGVNGTGTIVSGTGTITSAPNTTRVTTTSGQAIVNWRPTDTAPSGGAIDFLPAGNTLSFAGTGNYIVLNRFAGVDPVTGLPIPINRQIGLYGNINSVDAASGLRGGNIWFYNAGGFLINNSGVINVGSLVLTANDIDTGGGLLGPGGTIRFRGASGSTATVQIDGGASITTGNAATAGSSYMAVVAPRIVQRGLVDVDGSVAYVAAEQADITINNGLFDINVLVGAEGGTVIDHSGVTTGAAQRDGDGRDSRIYMVAMPKNDAVTMLVAGQVGYRDPVSAQIEPNGAIRLAAGYNIFQGEITRQPGSATAANLVIQDIIFNSELIARASNNLSAAPVGTIPTGFPAAFVPPPQLGLLRFNQNAALSGDNSATLSIANQQAVVALGNLALISGGRGGAPGLAQASLVYNGAGPGNRPILQVGGFLTLDSSRVADPFSGGDSSGGVSRISVVGGLINAGDIILLADGVAGFGSAAQGGHGRGGTTEFLLSGAGAVVNAASLRLSADGLGGGTRDNQNLGITEVANLGGTGTGGTAIVSVSGGASLNSTQGALLSANGFGGTGSQQSGNGTGGVARLSISGATSQVTMPFTLLEANGRGGSIIFRTPAIIDSGHGGDGTGGTSEIISDGIADLGAVFLAAEGTGGSANVGLNRGGDGLGGAANFLVSGGAAVLTQLTVNVDGLAGGGPSDPIFTTSVHGVGRGGNSAVRADRGTITINGDANFSGNGNTVAGAGVNTLQRSGGNVELRASNGGNILVAGTLAVQVNAGFDPTLGGNEGSNQNATGGTIRLSGVDGGTVSAAGLDLSAFATTSRATGAIGSATGGTITLEARNSGRVLAGNRGSFANASALAGSGPVGGQGLGGRIDAIADGGRIDLGGDAQFDANGTSGLSNSNIVAAIGLGGTVRFQTTASAAPSEIVFGDLLVNMNGLSGEIGEGGFVAGGNSAGDGRGGAFILDMAGGTIAGASLNIAANGFGGGADGALGGGNGTGGTIDLNLTGGLLDVDTIGLRAEGRGERGGSNQRGGQGTGGRVTVNLAGGTIDTNLLVASAAGFGGVGRAGIDDTGLGGALIEAGDGGRGVGGMVTFNANAGAVRAGVIRLDAGGTGGNGGSFDSIGSGTVRDTGDGGDGQAGSATFNLRGAAVGANLIDVLAQGRGGNGGALLAIGGLAGSGLGGDGGVGTGGQASFRIAGDASNIVLMGVNANARGGTGANAVVGGDGGAANGGTAQLIVDGVNAGTVNARIDGAANGGNGGNGSNGAGGNGGNGTAGTVRFMTIGANAAASFDPDRFEIETRGGRGGNGARDATLPAPAGGAGGGDGGRAMGGLVELVAAQGTLTLIPRGGGNMAEIFAYNTGGNGGDSGAADRAGNGGNATGPTVNLLAQGGTITSGGAPVRITAEAQASRGGQSASGATGNAGQAAGGTINIRAQVGPAGNGAINLGPTTLIAGSATGGRIDIRNQVTGDGLTFAGLNATANGVPLIAGGPALDDSGIYIDAGQGRVVVNGAAQLDTGSSLTLAALGGGSIQVNGNLGAVAGQRIDINHGGRTGAGVTIRATGNVTLNAGTDLASSSGLVIDSGGALSSTGTTSIALGDVAAATNIGATSGGNITLGRAQAGGNVTVQAGGTAILTGPATAGGTIDLRGAGLSFGNLTATNAITLTATAAGVTATGPLRAGTDLTVNAAGNIAIADARAGDDIRLTGASMTLGDLRATGTGTDNDGDGSDFVITSTGDVFVTHAEARSDFRANAVRLATGLNSIITGGDIIVTTVNALDLGNSTAGGQINATASQIAFNNLTAGTDVRLTTVPGRAVGPSGPLGDGSIIGQLINAGGLINANALNRIQLGNATATASVNLLAGAGIIFNRLSSGTTLSVDAATSIAGQRFNAGGNTALIARGGDVAIIDAATPAAPSSTGGNLQMRGTQVRFGAITVTGNADIDAATLLSGSSLTVGGVTVLDADSGTIDLTLASIGAITATADRATLRGSGTGALNFARITTDVDGATVTSAGDISVQAATLARASRFESTGGNVTLTQAAVANGNLTAVANRGLTLGAVSAAGDLDATAGRALTVNGAVSAANIRAASADIVIGTNGRLGTLGTTQSLTLTNNDRSATAFVGGTGTRSGWHLDSSEITRLFGGTISIDGGRVSAPGSTSIGSARAPDVVIDDFTVNAAQQFGPTGTFAITTSGKTRVIGDARFTDMADGQTIRLRADDALEVILGEGSVVLNGAGTALGGVLRLQSADVIVATRAAIADVAAAPTLAAINDRLALNDGITSDLGALVAKGMDVSVSGGFYVQNSGSPGIPRRDYANRRGLSFGALGLNIQLGSGSTGSSTGRIVINGQHIGATGPVTGLDAIALISINGTTGALTGFDPASTINGCLIVNVLACRANPDNFPIQDPINRNSASGESGGFGQGFNPIALITLRSIDPLGGEPLIDDPVTGAGNEDLWILDEEEATR